MTDDSPKRTAKLNRRSVLAGMAATSALTASESAIAGSRTFDCRLREAIDTVVVIYAENRSFNNLFADFPGLAQPLSQVATERTLQRDRDGTPLTGLPPIWDGMVPKPQIVDHREFSISQTDIAELKNAPFALATTDGEPLPHGVVTRDLIHSFYNNQLQINGGRNDGFVAWGDSGALVMGYYGNGRSNLRLWQLAREFTLCDNFFMGAFGGSFLNHQYLIAARPPFYPNADTSPAKDRIVRFDPAYPDQLRPLAAPGMASSAMDGPARFVPDTISPDFYAVNTMTPPFLPAYEPDPARPGYALASSSSTCPPQDHATIGDRLSARGIDWAWYAGGWGVALEGRGQSQEFPSRPNFQVHHQPFNYFNRFAPGSPDRARHLRDAGLGETARTNHFLADVEAGRLPPVTFYKPQGNLNMHAGYSDVEAGDRHIATVVDALRNSPQWGRMMVIVAFDENGGWWDHVSPPKGDRWGPGTRVPAIVISPRSRKGQVDHTVYDTGSISRFLIRRFDLESLPGLVNREMAMVASGGAPPGDLTLSLDL